MFNRWIGRTVTPYTGGVAGTPVTERFVYDGVNIALQFDTEGELTHRYLHGPAGDQILADEVLDPAHPENPGQINWQMTDNQNSVRDIILSDGTVLDHIDYTAFGAVKNQTAAVDHLFGAYGRPTDKDTHDINELNRWEVPDIGRWRSQDPIDFRGGDANLSRPVGNDPVNAVDPSGCVFIGKGGSQTGTTEVTPGSTYDPAPGGADAGADSLWSPTGWAGFFTGWERVPRGDGTYYWHKFSDPYSVNPKTGNLQAPSGPESALNETGQSLQTAIVLGSAMPGDEPSRPTTGANEELPSEPCPQGQKGTSKAPAAPKASPGLRRPSLTSSTQRAIRGAAQKTTDGKFIDPNTGRTIEGDFQYDHKYGYENRRLVAEGEARGMTQQEFNEWVNQHPEWFQIEDPLSNMSHVFEKPGK